MMTLRQFVITVVIFCQIMKIFINNPFPLLLLKQETSVRCLDLSSR